MSSIVLIEKKPADILISKLFFSCKNWLSQSQGLV